MRRRSSALPDGIPGTIHVTVGANPFALLVASIAQPCPARRAARAAYACLGRELVRHGLSIVQERVLGSVDSAAGVLAERAVALRAAGVDSDGPCTFVEGRPLWGRGWAGAILLAVRTADAGGVPRVLHDGGVPCGRTWRLKGARFVALQGIGSRPDAAAAPQGVQAERAIRTAARLLRRQGLRFADVLRTWFYLRRILSWYGEFNAGRRGVFRRLGLLHADGAAVCRLPASTGISGRTRGRAACSLDLLAAAPAPRSGMRVEERRSPVQPRPLGYGSAFSRAATVSGGNWSLLEISGTAAVDASGRSAHPGDAPAQVGAALDAVRGLLDDARGGREHFGAATVFVKRPADAASCRAALESHGSGARRWPAVWVQADVCRPELLFEVDGEALSSSKAGSRDRRGRRDAR